MATPDVRVRLSVEGINDVIAAFKKIESQATASGRKIASSFDPVSAALGKVQGLLGAFGLALSIGSIIAFERRAADLGEELSKATQKLGGATRETVGLALAAKLANADLATLDGTMGATSKNIAAFENGGGKAAKALHALGFEAGDFKGKSLTEAIVAISQRLGPIADGWEKDALAADIFGKKAVALIPLFNSLSREGMDQFIDRAGRLFSPDVIASAEQFNDALRRTEFELQGVGAQFIGGLAPAVVEQLSIVDKNITSTATGAAELGKIFGVAFKVIAAGLITVGALLAGFSASVGFGLVGAWQAATLALRGHFKEAGERVALAQRQISAITGHEIADIRNAWANAFRAAPPLTGPASGGRPAPNTTDRRAATRAASEADLAAAKALFKAEEDAAKSSYEHGLIQLREFLAIRGQLLNEEHQAELRSLRTQLANVTDDDETKALAQRAKIRGEIQVKETEFAAKQRALAIEGADLQKKLALEVEAAEAKIDQTRSGEHQHRLNEIDEQIRKYRILLQQQGHSPDEISRRLSLAGNSLTGAAVATKELRAYQDALNSLDNDRAGIELKVKSGQLSEAAGKRELLRLDREQHDALLRLAEAALAAAKASGSQDLIQQMTELVARTRAVGVELDQAGVAGRELGTNLAAASVSDLGTALGEVGHEADGAKNAFSAMAESIANDIQRIIADLFALQIKAAFLGLFTGGGKAVGPSDPRFIGPTLAGGGLISGPGSGTSDSIPAWVSNHEFIEPAAAVRQPGVLPLLESIRRMDPGVMKALRPMSLRPLTGSPKPLRFAEGGLVGVAAAAAAAGGGSQTIKNDASLTVRLAPGLEAADFTTHSGFKLLLHKLAANKNAVNALLGR